MNEVQIKILELIENGNINVDEAVKLLEATSNTGASSCSSASKENVESLFEDLLDKVKTTAKTGKTEFEKQFKNKETNEGDPIRQLDESLRDIIRSFNRNNDQNKDI
ncbi:SHOCT-like domain-containing protein [Mammaliicoccus stepanovicii]|uniref:YvlB/LiaX N-terminal domain-containing protein n=1 Tax=Mammaliicoccus stepanovicii TaxID=643214 RepID=A0A239ZY82_9STAP|nr:hypothetical protein [Mammaliicoccus stepanovicii]PNZ79308.1 hypothetical protein CD111_00290 [Mammaliicoccus stepanovicii]GGI39211.1 hypothetical protein GCM10010896_02250 [Mammaliicoccus stepanovicii]SNV75754.1 Uncharacterised protein [Mammaliicoccus stepanovicii]